jgi:hypothetical protein
VERALGIPPAVYTATAFWDEFIVHPNAGIDVEFFARYLLWLVDLYDKADPKAMVD